MKVAFLDRDGTVNKSFWTRRPDGYTDFWNGSEIPELLPGVAEGLRHLKARGYEIIIITNQYPIGEGQITQEFYDSFMEKLLDQLHENGTDVLDVFFCPHARSENCACCKPRPGMIEAALQKYPDIEMDKSFFAGDSAADAGIAKACNLPFYGVNRDEGTRISSLGDLIHLV